MAKDNSLRVEGATLFYQVRGSGPPLLILQSGHGDADAANALCDELADRYTVITYDRRGMSRSKIDAPDESLTLATHSDDAHRLFTALTNERSFVFGSSIGALIGLDLVARHPDQVAVLVAHEPPAFELLPEKERNRAMRLQEEAEEAFRREGAEAGFKKFVELAAVDYNDREPEVALPPPTSQTSANLSFFFANDSPAVRRYRLDLAALHKSSTRIVPAVGQSAAGSAPYEAAEALAEKLGLKSAVFPGGHTGWLLRPKGFAAKLKQVLGG
ncbi:MAG TPA: alpha/beta hydrolase [Blastocatellia bacterium]|nr:alpha/beta hydrolase [Blastocatellia bacterium]